MSSEMVAEEVGNMAPGELNHVPDTALDVDD